MHLFWICECENLRERDKTVKSAWECEMLRLKSMKKLDEMTVLGHKCGNLLSIPSHCFHRIKCSSVITKKMVFLSSRAQIHFPMRHVIIFIIISSQILLSHRFLNWTKTMLEISSASFCWWLEFSLVMPMSLRRYFDGTYYIFKIRDSFISREISGWRCKFVWNKLSSDGMISIIWKSNKVLIELT